MKKILITILLFSASIVFAKETTEVEVYSHMPLGDVMHQSIQFMQDKNETLANSALTAESVLKLAQQFLEALNTCKNTSACQPSCQQYYDANNNCRCQSQSCSPNQLCDMAKIQDILDKAKQARNTFQDTKSAHLDAIGQTIVVPDYLQKLAGTDYTNLPKSRLYTDYNQFYKDYNELIAPITGRSLPAPSLFGKQFKIPVIELIKRQADFARVGFANCETPMNNDDDIEKLNKGDAVLKYPARVDYALGSGLLLPTEKDENNLNYYCVGIKGFYTPPKK